MRTPTFNTDIFVQRLEYWADTILRFQDIHAQERKIPRLYVACGGDFVEGEPYTHRINLGELDVDTKERRVMDVLAQKRLIQETFAAALYKLSQSFEAVVVKGVYGNHGAGRGWLASKRSNDDTEVYLNVADRLHDVRNLFFEIEQDNFYQVFPVFSIKFLLVHGHQVRMWSRTPLYGVTNKVLLWKQILPQFDVALVAHFHSRNLLDALGTPIYMNGCFGGDSEYEQAAGLKATLTQWVIGVHPTKGISWDRNVRFDFMDGAETPPAP